MNRTRPAPRGPQGERVTSTAVPGPGLAPWDPARYSGPAAPPPWSAPPAPGPVTVGPARPGGPGPRRRRARAVLITLGVLALVLVAVQAALSPPRPITTPGPTPTPVQALPRLDALLQQTRAVLPPGADLHPGPVAHYDCGTGRQSVYETVTVTGVPPTPGADRHRWDALAARIQQDWAARGYVGSDYNASETGAPLAIQWTWQVEDEYGHAGPGTRPTGNGWDVTVTEVEDRLTDGVMLSANAPCLWITGQPPTHR